MKYRIQSFDVFSVARTIAGIYGGLALIVSLFMLLAALVSAIAPPSPQTPPPAFFLFFALGTPFLYAAIGLLMGAVVAVAYNFVAGKFGGIEADLEAIPEAVTSPASLPQV